MREVLIVAMDVPNACEARQLVDEIGEDVAWFKIGLQLFTALGPEFVREVAGRHKVFLDLKFHDIPHTVASAIRSAGDLGVKMLTVHACGGEAMLDAASEAIIDFPGLSVVGVTVLTSQAVDETTAKGLVLDYARTAKECGLQGIVCSAKETHHIRQLVDEPFLIVNPGIRLPDQDVGDQRRVATPASALASGASYIVVGRPILNAPDRKKAINKIYAAMT